MILWMDAVFQRHNVRNGWATKVTQRYNATLYYYGEGRNLSLYSVIPAKAGNHLSQS